MTLEYSCQRETDLKHTTFVRHALLYCMNKYLCEIKCLADTNGSRPAICLSACSVSVPVNMAAPLGQ